ncbi:MAG: HIT family protein [Planctomycetaceae bacterium]
MSVQPVNDQSLQAAPFTITKSPATELAMPTLFTRIIQGEIPGRLVYQDHRCVAFLTIAPIRLGHTLVVPIEEVDHWIDLPDDLTAHLFQVATKVGQAIQTAFQPTKVGMMIAGLEVPHTHLHLVPIQAIGDLDFSKQDQHPDPAAMDDAMLRLRAALGWQPQA